MKKKLLLAISSVVLVGALAIGGTLAFLTQKTETKKNVFTAGNDDLGGHIEEEFDEDEASSFMPGSVITKIPTLVNEDDSIAAWVAVKVDFYNTTYGKNEKITYDQFQEKYGDVFFDKNAGFNTNDYELIAKDGEMIFMYKSVLDAGATTTPVFDSVHVSAGLEKVTRTSEKNIEIYKEVSKGEFVMVDSSTQTTADEKLYYKDAAGNYREAEDDVLPSFNVEVTGYMVQAANVTDEDAVKELLDLATSTN